MNNYISLEQSDQAIPLTPESENINPEDMFISDENVAEIRRRINDSLSPMENQPVRWLLSYFTI